MLSIRPASEDAVEQVSAASNGLADTAVQVASPPTDPGHQLKQQQPTSRMAAKKPTQIDLSSMSRLELELWAKDQQILALKHQLLVQEHEATIQRQKDEKGKLDARALLQKKLLLDCTKEKQNCDKVLTKMDIKLNVKDLQAGWLADVRPDDVPAKLKVIGKEVEEHLKANNFGESAIREFKDAFKVLVDAVSSTGAAILVKLGITKLVAKAMSSHKGLTASGAMKYLGAVPSVAKKTALFCGLVVTLGITALVVSKTWMRFKEMKEIEGELEALGDSVKDMFQEVVALKVEADINQFLEKALQKLGSITGIMEMTDEISKKLQDLGEQAQAAKRRHAVGLGGAITGTVVAVGVASVAIAVATAGVALPAVAASAAAVGASEGVLINAVGGVGVAGAAAGAGGIAGTALGFKWNNNLLKIVKENRYHLKSMVVTMRSSIDIIEAKTVESLTVDSQY
ncbi:hypothetical protein HDU93_007440 [Gonapodya sp. JEL0774]|nr:hypothetical protein HDU93_007440 [Gonapodya sp. JEL0774]